MIILKENLFFIGLGVVTLILIITSLTFITLITGNVIGQAKSNFQGLFLLFVIIGFFVFLEILLFIRVKKKKIDIKELIEQEKNRNL